MIKRYTFGSPFVTDSVVLPLATEKNPALPRGQGHFFLFNDTEAFCWNYEMDKGTRVYGLGENLHGINKRGHIYQSFCSDDPNHTEDKKSLYAAHNFILIVPDAQIQAPGRNPFGVFFDYPGRITFDTGFSKENEITVTCEKPDIDVYVITPENSDSPELSICSQLRKLTGSSYIPPQWGFGYMQSRWGYKNAQDIRAVVKGYRDSDIPLEAVFMDIDYMDDYMDFTVDSSKFPDFPDFVKEMQQDDIHLVPIIDAGVKIKEGYSVYEEGLEKSHFCTDKSQNSQAPFTAAVWPGMCHFPDFLNPEARRWFGLKYKSLLDAGIDGFWNDMNEPAIFYSKAGLKKSLQTIQLLKDKNMGVGDYFTFRDCTNLSNKDEDYKNIMHKVPVEKAGAYGEQNLTQGDTLVNHYDVHNLYGYNMTRSASEAITELTQKPVLLFSRASCIGAHRYGGIWTGDNQSIWSHLKLNVAQMVGLNMCGFLYSGADTGGFGFNASRELLMRWVQFSIFTPLFRNHAIEGCRFQELYNFENTRQFQTIIETRYRLLPYITKTFMDAAKNDGMYFKPLAFIFRNDQRACKVEDQLMVGDDVMIAPVITENSQGRYVYLPEDMTMVYFGGENRTRASTKDAFTLTPLAQGDHWIEIPEENAVFFIRKNRSITVAELPSGKINTRTVSDSTDTFTLQG